VGFRIPENISFLNCIFNFHKVCCTNVKMVNNCTSEIKLRLAMAKAVSNVMKKKLFTIKPDLNLTL
jgi:hypothetical protein